MPLLIRIMTGLVAGVLLFAAAGVDPTGPQDFIAIIWYWVIAIIWVVIGLALAAHLEDIE